MLRRFFHKHMLEAGCDEAGRGCLAGPVCAAAVILPKNFYLRGLNDSKQVTAPQRSRLRKVIEKKALGYGVAFIDNVEIDRVNILRASFLAMHKALDQLTIAPEFLLIDGNRFTPYRNIPHECIVEGDAKYQSIAAASILAKTWRDEYMEKLHEDFPHYRWDLNKGYATEFHREVIITHGITSYHRQSFRLYPVPEQLELF